MMEAFTYFSLRLWIITDIISYQKRPKLERIRFHFMKRLLGKINPQRLIVALCVLAVCIGTQQMQTAAWYTGRIEFFRDALGILMAVIIMTNYKWKDFVQYKIPYLIWTVLGICLEIVLVPAALRKDQDFFQADVIVIALGIFLVGYCVIHTVISFFVEKHRPKYFIPLFGIWIVMMLLMVFSRSEYLWPECYFVLFLTYYMTKQTPEQRENTGKGIVDGIILSFLLIQGHALLCRPYDRVRYYGNFCNPNHNCLFLCICLVAILSKLLFLYKEGQKKALKILYFLMAGVCYVFICMTMCHSGYLATVVVTVVFLLAYCRIRQKKVFFRTGFLLIALFVCLMPVTYCAVRYIPTIHPHVLIYYQEGYSESRVHPWDDRQSPKYVTFQQLLQGILGRFEERFSLFSILDLDTDRATEMVWQETCEIQIASNVSELPADFLLYVKNDTKDSVADPDKIPALEEESDGFLIRYTIYKWYFEHLTFRGMPFDEQGFQLTKTHWIQDTHNIYLDYGINFGYPVMILFVILGWWGVGRLAKNGLREREPLQLSALMIALVPLVFGMFEFAWGAGMISSVTLYLSFKEMICVES